MLDADHNIAAGTKTFARKEYSVDLTVLPWLRMATGKMIMPAFACISWSHRTATFTATARSSRARSLNVNDSWRIAHLLAVKYAQLAARKAKEEWQFHVSYSSSAPRASLMLLGVRSCNTRIAFERRATFLAGSWHWLCSRVPGQAQEAGAELCS